MIVSFGNFFILTQFFEESSCSVRQLIRVCNRSPNFFLKRVKLMELGGRELDEKRP